MLGYKLVKEDVFNSSEKLLFRQVKEISLLRSRLLEKGASLYDITEIYIESRKN